MVHVHIYVYVVGLFKSNTELNNKLFHKQCGHLSQRLDLTQQS